MFDADRHHDDGHWSDAVAPGQGLVGCLSQSCQTTAIYDTSGCRGH
jgi:hypothetical protein